MLGRTKATKVLGRTTAAKVLGRSKATKVLGRTKAAKVLGRTKGKSGTSFYLKGQPKGKSKFGGGFNGEGDGGKGRGYPGKGAWVEGGWEGGNQGAWQPQANFGQPGNYYQREVTQMPAQGRFVYQMGPPPTPHMYPETRVNTLVEDPWIISNSQGNY